MITAYRMCRKDYAAVVWSGAGARDHGARWNSKGVAVVYASQSIALAAMEQLVHLIPPRVLDGFVVASITFDSKQMDRVESKALPANWSDAVAPVGLRQYGDKWIAAARAPVLAVPSAVIMGEWNYLINPAHPAFAKMTKSSPEPFAHDRRLG